MPRPNWLANPWARNPWFETVAVAQSRAKKRLGIVAAAVPAAESQTLHADSSRRI